MRFATATHCDWHSRYENGHRVFGSAEEQLTRTCMLGCWATRYAASRGDMNTSLSLALDALRLARFAGTPHDSPALLMQSNAERDLLQTLLDQTAHMTLEQKNALREGIGALPSGTSFRAAILTDRAVLIANQIQDLRALQTSAPFLFFPAGERASTYSNNTAPQPADATNTPSPHSSWLTENVRMSALIDDGSGPRIALELKTGESFFLEPGQCRYGVRLLSIDLRKQEAILVSHGDTAFVQLKDRDIRPLEIPFPTGPLHMTDEELA